MASLLQFTTNDFECLVSLWLLNHHQSSFLFFPPTHFPSFGSLSHPSPSASHCPPHCLPPFLSISFSFSTPIHCLFIAVTVCQNRWNQLLTLSGSLPTRTSPLIEGINEWSVCEMIWCHESQSALCRIVRLGEGLFGQPCRTDSVRAVHIFQLLLLANHLWCWERLCAVTYYSANCYITPPVVTVRFKGYWNTRTSPMRSALCWLPLIVASVGCISTSALCMFIQCFWSVSCVSFSFNPHFFLHRWNLLSLRQPLPPSIFWLQ